MRSIMCRLITVFIFFFSFLCVAQHQDKVDFLSAKVLVYPIPEKELVEGQVDYQFVSKEKVDSIFLDAKNMNFTSVELNNKNSQFDYDGKQIIIRGKFKKGQIHSLRLKYSCNPKQTVYFVGWEDIVVGNEQIWTQGQGKYTSHWLPSFDDMEEKVEFDLSVKTTKDFTVISNGKMINRQELERNIIWQFEMQQPMSSYLLAFAIGYYNKQELVSNSGIPLENYYYPSDSLRVEPTYRYTKEIFDFLEAEIGVPYPWQNYKQVPVHDFLYAGMENTGATIFSDGFMIDSTAFIDKNYVNVNAHELAHQWFGNLVTEKDGKHHWLHEGFATYYAYLAEKQLFGDDHFYWKLYSTALQLRDLSDKGEGQSLLNPKASSLTFYEKGAWALVALREVIGDDAFRNGVQNYLSTYKFKNATVSQFLQEMARAKDIDLLAYKNKWLDSEDFPMEEAMAILVKHIPSLDLLSQLNFEFESTQSDHLDYEAYWNASSSVNFKQYVIKKHHRVLPRPVIEKAFAMDIIPIRQALAVALLSISPSEEAKYVWKNSFESLLKDESYVTKELALIKLWSTFEEDRGIYLNQLENVEGLPNKNIRLLWLTLALVTPEYRVGEKPLFFKELSSYTGTNYNPEVRQTAFQFLVDIEALSEPVFKDLIQATNHHSWQFRNFARRLLDELWKDEGIRIQLQEIAKRLNVNDLRYFNTKLNLE